MPFDLRIPIGLMFGIYGLILIGTGLLGGPELTRPSLGLNMNLIWGAVLLIFGLFMLAWWRLGRRK